MDGQKNGDGSEEHVLKISGMHCKSCTEKIESGVGSLKGVQSVKADLLEDTVSVRFHPEETSLETIESELQKIGYGTKGDALVKEGSRGNGKEGNTLVQGIIYGLVPHIGCIAFIIASVLGVTVAINLFKPLLMNPYFFHALIALALVFATISSAYYLRKQGLLSVKGAKKKWKYLSVMYGSTVGINLVLFMVIFPLLANAGPISGTGALAGVGAAAGVGGSLSAASFSTIKMSVDIPCPGHAPLISGELRTIDGVQGVRFDFPNIFLVSFDSGKTSKEEMLALEVFKTYPATVLEESGGEASAEGGGSVSFDDAGVLNKIEKNAEQPGAPAGSCGGSCGGSGCPAGGSGSSCGCGGELR